MKSIFALAALATLAACSQTETAPEPAATEDVVAEAAAPTAADGGPSTGSYKVTMADGSVVMEDVKADGTYVDTVDGKPVETGKWEQKAPETYCYTKDEEGAVQVCNTEAVDENGVWTSTNPDGETATIERVTT